jgi:ATP-independent RNA helicase DbpA
MTPSFDTLALLEPLRAVLRELGLTTPTPIQVAALPPLLEGRDVVGRSETGSGKTLAFALPLLQGLRLHNRRVQALVLCPTRELCAQVAGEVRKLGRRLPGLRVLEVAGGQPGFAQRRALEEGVHVVVGTPGRCIDQLDRGVLDLRLVKIVVLDEADRMLDMGFALQMDALREALPVERQTALFSATFPEKVAEVCARWQVDPVRVEVEARKPDIHALAVEVAPDGRFDALLAVLGHDQPASALVFCNLKTTVMDVAAALQDRGIAAAELHGDLEQPERDRVMARLRNGSVRVLVATDVAARGLDVAGLDLVVSYEVPTKPDVYTHRVGRTGRAGRPGRAVTLVTERERSKLEWVAGPVERLDALERREVAQDPGMQTLYIGGGRRDKLRPGDILGALTGDAGLAAADIGRIEIHDRFSYVAVASGVAAVAHERLANGRIKARRFKVERVR